MLAGGRKGHKGGGGRPPDEIRRALREDFFKNLKNLQKWAKSDDPAIAMKAMEMQAKYGVGTTFTETDDQGRALHSVKVTHQVVDAGGG